MSLTPSSTNNRKFKVVKPKKNARHTTKTTRQHRFQSFTERVANLRIDPIRRRRLAGEQEQAADDRATFFGRSLAEWRDKNLSHTFTGFAREVAPLSDNLVLVLHNEHAILDLLLEYIEKADALALEPLLSLLAQFAHDLDARFERHFERAVSTILNVAAIHKDLAVVEWSFSCLAWLFKYLSRLLAPDLRPLYDLLAPFLGKQPQRPFVVRFVAESFSFLLRKAATIYQRDHEPLDSIIAHILKDCTSCETHKDTNLYQQGIMTLLTESMKGLKTGIHTVGVFVMQSLLTTSEARVSEEASASETIVYGSLTSLIHHCDADSFAPILGTLLTHVEDASRKALSRGVFRFAASLILTVAAVRKGTRIAEWKRIAIALRDLLTHVGDESVLRATEASAALSALAVISTFATIDGVLLLHDTFKLMRARIWQPYFLQFCDMAVRLSRERFQSFILPEFRIYVLEQASLPPHELLSKLPRLLGTKNNSISVSDETSSLLLDSLDLLAFSKAKYASSPTVFTNALQNLSVLSYCDLSPKVVQRLNVSLTLFIELCLKDDGLADQVRFFGLGPCLEHIFHTAEDSNHLPDHWWRGFCEQSSRMRSYPKFWLNVLKFLKSVKPSVSDEPYVKLLTDNLKASLSSPSHLIRQSALDVLEQMLRLQGTDNPRILSTAITIESTPISLETSRSLSMNIRRLGSEYASLGPEDIMSQAIPNFCFGLLHMNLAQAWDDAIDAIAVICQSRVGEETVSGLTQAWLEGKSELLESEENDRSIIDINTDGYRAVSDFECVNLTKCEAIRDQVFDSSPLSHCDEQSVASELSPTPTFTPISRAQALRVLNKLPQLAEKRSRMLVPVLLQWAGVDLYHGVQPNVRDRWSRKDQKAMLSIFAKFTNPKVLYKSADVFDALLSLCGNGDAEIQRFALKAIIAWKDPAIVRYEEHLANLVDEERFREEVSVFLREDDGDEGIKVQDQAQLMPVLLRLLYGRAIAGGKNGQAGRRKAIFVALSRFGDTILQQYVDISVSSVARGQPSPFGVQADDAEHGPIRQQLGLLNMLHDMLLTLGAQLESVASKIMSTVLEYTLHASVQIAGSTDDQPATDISLLRSVRQVGIQSFVRLYATMKGSEVLPFQRSIFENILLPRLQQFPDENAHSISGLLRLIATWTLSSDSAIIFLGAGGTILESLALLLAGKHTKEEVRLFVLQEITPNLLEVNKDNIMQPYISAFVKSIGEIVSQEPGKDLLKACVSSFTQLADRIVHEDEAALVLEICTKLLMKPSVSVSQGTKVGLLRTSLPLIKRFVVQDKMRVHDALSGLYSRFQDHQARGLVGEVLIALARDDEVLLQAAQICTELNAMGTKLDEPDNEQRELAFVKIYESAMKFTLTQWAPILNNCLFYIRDDEDRVNRSSAAHALQRFVQAVAARNDDQESWLSVLETMVLPSIERGCQAPSEIVRNEFIVLLGHIVQELPTWPKVKGMQSLTVGGDEEASFFNNILHIQHHRRLRALRRLAEHASELSNSSISRTFLPLVEHFVFDPVEGDAGRTLSDQAVQTIGALAKALQWSSFRMTFKRYAGYLKTKEDMEKVVLRLLGSMVDSNLKVENVSTVTQEFLPPLLGYLHHKDESTVDRRMPLAVTIVKLLLTLPEEETAARLPAALTDVCQVLRSKSQEARDETRKALAAISSLVGSRYFNHILKELRSALKRGTQLHVLSYTVHSLLVTTNLEPEDLEMCLSELMAVIMDDIFGLTGQEKDAEEYKSALKEVKSSKSFDTLELLARVTPIRKLGELVRPIQSLLSERLDTKMVAKIDELLVRIRKGLDQNPASDSRDMLAFCWEVVDLVQKSQSVATRSKEVIDPRRSRYLVQPETSNKGHRKPTSMPYSFKLAAFAFNLLRKLVRRYDDLLTSQNMAGFLPMASDAMVIGHEEVKLSAVKFLSTLMRITMPQLDTNAGLYVKESIAMITSSTSTTTDASKAALELITSVLREKRSVSIREQDIAPLLKKLKNDIDEPDRQGIVYKFLRAVIGRKIVVTEVYEVMDEVGRTMVTNSDRSVRESARSAYLQFVTEFPQGKGRWDKQVAFLIGNLQYQHAAGRQSVMELFNQLLTKIDVETFQDTCAKLFVSLLPVLVSDSDNSCQDMARLLLGKIFESVNNDTLSSFLNMMSVWLRTDKKSTTKSGALQCWGVLLMTRPPPSRQIDQFRDSLVSILMECATEQNSSDSQLLTNALKSFEALVEAKSPVAFAKSTSEVWRLIQEIPVSVDVVVHESVAKLLGSLFTDFASTSSQATSGLSSLPLRGSGGLELGAEDMRRLCATCLRSMRAITLSTFEAIVLQTSRNLVFLGRCFASNDMPWRGLNADAAEDSADDELSEQGGEDDAALQDDDATIEPAIAYLVKKLTQIVQQDKFSVVARTAALQCQTALVNQLSAVPNIQLVLRPLYALTDPTNPQPPGDLHKHLVEKAHELLDLLQQKLGSEAYIAALAVTRAEAKKRRDDRRQKRRIDAVAAPERWAKEKKRRHEQKKVKQKQKAEEARGKRRGW